METDTYTSHLLSLTYSRLPYKYYTLDENVPPVVPSDRILRDSPKASLGMFDMLSVELIQDILSYIDMESVMDFRILNRRAMQVVETTPPYKAVAKHAPKVLRAIRATGVGRWITCQELYEKMCTQQCESCEELASHLYLLTFSRVCFHCLVTNKKYKPIAIRKAIFAFDLSKEAFDALPKMKCVPGRYTPYKIPIRKRYVYVDHESAFHAGIVCREVSGTMEPFVVNEMMTGFPDEVEPRRRRPLADCSVPSTSLIRNPTRFLAAVSLPWWDPVTKKLDPGFYCVGCAQSEDDGSLDVLRKYTLASFYRHLVERGPILDGKH